MNTKTRIVGSGFTTFNWNGQPIAWLDGVADQGQAPVSGAEAITPIGDLYPREVAVNFTLGAGILSFTIRELWNGPIWEQLAGLENVGDVAVTDVYQALAAMSTEITCQMIVKPPGSNTWRGRLYHNVQITGIQDGDQIATGGMTVAKSLTAWYTHKTPLLVPAAA